MFLILVKSVDEVLGFLHQYEVENNGRNDEHKQTHAPAQQVQQKLLLSRDIGIPPQNLLGFGGLLDFNQLTLIPKIWLQFVQREVIEFLQYLIFLLICVENDNCFFTHQIIFFG